MMTGNNSDSKWPPRPDVFPEVMTSLEVAMFLRLDKTCEMPEGGVRRVCDLVKSDGLPRLRTVGRGHRFSKAAVLRWAEDSDVAG